MPLLLFVAADALGTLLRDGLFVVIGYTAGSQGVSIARRVSELAVWITGALVILLLAVLLIRAARLRRQRAGETHRPQGPSK
jgi:membrane protein DedA with SNARE-associated domain